MIQTKKMKTSEEEKRAFKHKADFCPLLLRSLFEGKLNI